MALKAGRVFKPKPTNAAKASQPDSLPSFAVTRAADSLTFWVKVRPRSSRERITLDSGSGEIRLDVHAPPSEGEANDACRKLVAKSLAVPVSTVTIVTGGRSRRKLIRIESGAQEVLRRCLEELCESY